MAPIIDEEKALVMPKSPMEYDLDERGTALSYDSAMTPQHEQSSTPVNHIPATPGFGRNKDTGQNHKKKPPPKLLHPILNRIPFHMRFGLNGFLSNLLFMIAYNAAVVKFEHTASSSTIYAIVYLIFIPISHVLISLLVFGWPERYVRSLMSNAPVGLTAIILGAGLTAYLDDIEFNSWVADAMVEYEIKLGLILGAGSTANGEATLMPAPGGPMQRALHAEETRGGGEFYSSLFVLIITSIWTFVLSVMVNAPAESLEKKEL